MGVPLDDLERAFRRTTLKAKRDDDALLVRHERLTTRIDVVPPVNPKSEDKRIQAVVQITTTLPDVLNEFLLHPTMISSINARATLGALTVDRGRLSVGSRITVFEQEDAWQLQFPLIMSSVIAGPDSILGAARRMFENVEPRSGASEWTESDFLTTESHLSEISVCTAGGRGLTAEFGLRRGAVSEATGHLTALWQMQADQPHPQLGGGLFCSLQLPHRLGDEEQLDQILLELNQMEMAAHDLSPHFGAWCRGNLNNNPAYVAFLPNALHAVAGIATNMSFWAVSRAHVADAVLASFGIRGAAGGGRPSTFATGLGVIVNQ